MLKLALALTSLLSLPALAADQTADQQLLLAPAAPAQSVTEAEAAPTAKTDRISFGIGTGVNTFGGNLGKLYSTSTPVAEGRLEWAFSRLFGLRFSAEGAGYNFNAAPNGSVEVSTRELELAGQCHVLSTALSTSGFDPYVSAGAGHVWRTQNFLNHNSVEKDNAFTASLGLGTGYHPAGARIGVWLEAAAGQIFFQDRFEQQYLESGLEDQTGLLYSARLGVKFVF